jgi:hypothetical protein
MPPCVESVPAYEEHAVVYEEHAVDSCGLPDCTAGDVVCCAKMWCAQCVQHTSAYVSIRRQHTSAYQHTSALRQNYVSIRQHTSAHLRSVLLCKHMVCAMRACRLRANFLDILPSPLVHSGGVDDFIVLEILLQTYLSLGA